MLLPADIESGPLVVESDSAQFLTQERKSIFLALTQKIFGSPFVPFRRVFRRKRQKI